MRRPGPAPSRPRPGRALGPLGLHAGREHEAGAGQQRDPVAEGAVVLDVARPRSRRRPRRTACGPSRLWSTSDPPRPGSSGNVHRIGWVIENANRPPGRSTRATSATASPIVGDELQRAERREHDVEGRVGEGELGRGARRPTGRRRRCASSMRRECWSWRWDRSRPEGPAAPAAQPARALAGAAADLEHARPASVAEDAGSCASVSPRAPTRSRRRRGSRRGWPGTRRRSRPSPRPVGPPGLRLADGDAVSGRSPAASRLDRLHDASHAGRPGLPDGESDARRRLATAERADLAHVGGRACDRGPDRWTPRSAYGS